VAERSEAKSAKRSFASKSQCRDIIPRKFASLFHLRYAQRCLAKLEGEIYWSFFPQWSHELLTEYNFKFDVLNLLQVYNAVDLIEKWPMIFILQQLRNIDSHYYQCNDLAQREICSLADNNNGVDLSDAQVRLLLYKK
jgi:hypothetical protein